MTVPFDDSGLEELLGAYALDACDPEEAAALEAAQLADAAVWIGASEALEPPVSLRRAVFDHARLRRADPDQPARLYEAEAQRLAREVDLLDSDHDEVRTANGLTARGLVIHLGAQESLLARSVGRLVEPDLDVEDIDDRTAAYGERFRDAAYDDVVAFWRSAVQAVREWSDDPTARDADVEWLGLALKRDNLLIALAFENWTHRDDLRRVRGQASAPPPAPELHLMAEMSMRTLPFGLVATDRSRPGRLARVVLTGDGGGSWRVCMGPDVERDAEPDVMVTTDVVDWCRVASERLPVADLHPVVDGDEHLAKDLLVAASAFATL